MSDWELVHYWYAEYNGEFEEIEWRVEIGMHWGIQAIEEDWIVIRYAVTREVSYGGA